MNPLQRLARNPTAYRWLVRAGCPLIEALESVLRFLSVGRVDVLELAGLPGVRITVSGRKTGLARTATVLSATAGDGLIVVGSNWGRRRHPSWSANLKSAQRVSVRRGRQVFTAEVRFLTGAERETAWATALRQWPNYRIAESLSGGRQFRLFLLTSTV